MGFLGFAMGLGPLLRLDLSCAEADALGFHGELEWDFRGTLMGFKGNVH